MSSRIISALRERDEIDLSGLGTKKTAPLLAELQAVLVGISDEELTPMETIGLVKAYYLELMKETYDDWDKRALDIEVLETLAARYRSLERFISDFALDPPSTKFQDETTPRVDETEEGSLVLSTIHSAKGLEWSVVFVPHLLDGLFPSDRSVGDLEELEEERRLFYVACTRAKNALYLTMPASFSSWGVWFTLPSRFLAEVDHALYRYVPDLEGLEEDEEDWT
jgi:DNA helicase-2/ATP-dependent DNA helicase PcrA